jgi:hypothetical protein
MSDYAALEAIDAAFPGGTADAARVAAINAVTVSVAVAAPVSQWEGYLLAHGYTIGIQAYNTAPPAGASTQAIAAARMILLLLSSTSISTVDMTDPVVSAEVTACLTALVAEGAAGRLTSIGGTPFSSTDMSALLAMGSAMTSQAAQCGFAKPITVDDLIAARDPQRGAGSAG